MKRYAIITHVRREDGYAGGVPKWAWYLKRAISEAGHEVQHFIGSDNRRTKGIHYADQ